MGKEQKAKLRNVMIMMDTKVARCSSQARTLKSLSCEKLCGVISVIDSSFYSSDQCIQSSSSPHPHPHPSIQYAAHQR